MEFGDRPPTTCLTVSNRVHVKLLQKLKTNRVPRLSKQLSLFILTSLFYSRSVENCKFSFRGSKMTLELPNLNLNEGTCYLKDAEYKRNGMGTCVKMGRSLRPAYTSSF